MDQYSVETEYPKISKHILHGICNFFILHNKKFDIFFKFREYKYSFSFQQNIFFSILLIRIHKYKSKQYQKYGNIRFFLVLTYSYSLINMKIKKVKM